MKFECDGVRYDSNDLHVFHPQSSYMRLIFMTRDYSRVMVGVVDRWTGFNIRGAGCAEIEYLAERYGIQDLKRALGHATGGCVPNGLISPRAQAQAIAPRLCHKIASST
ncbi:MAG TPA: hypothetical protein VH475_23645 [Tepidisphaeraceae bacterium]|jgi:hypothetical protein